jgi:hypothetical protein
MITVVQCVSIVACGTVVVLYVWLKELQQFTFKLVIYLVIADICKGIAWLLSPDDELMCVIQGILTVYFQLSSILWVAVISHVMFAVIVDKDLDIATKEMRYVMLCNLVPLVACLLPLVFDKYGYAEGWCSVEESGHDFVREMVLRVLVFYGPLYLVFGYSSYTYHRVRKELRKFTEDNDSMDTLKVFMHKLYLYPVVLMLSYGFVTVFRIYTFIFMGGHHFVFSFVSALLISLNGFLNAVVYGVNKQVQQSLKDKCRGRSRRSSLSFLSFDDDLAH